LNALPALPVRARTVSGCLNSALLGLERNRPAVITSQLPGEPASALLCSCFATESLAQTAPLSRATNLHIKASRVPPCGFVQEPVPERPQTLAVKSSSAQGPSGTGFFLVQASSFSLPNARLVPVKSWSCTSWFGQWFPDPPGLCDRRSPSPRPAARHLETRPSPNETDSQRAQSGSKGGQDQLCSMSPGIRPRNRAGQAFDLDVSPMRSRTGLESCPFCNTFNTDRPVFVPAPIPLEQHPSHVANRISLTARFSGCARCDLGRASARPWAAGTAGTGGSLGNPVPPRQGVRPASRRVGNDRAGPAQGGYAQDRPGPGLLHRQDPEAVHQQRLCSGENRGARHLRGRRGGDGPVQSRQRRTSRRDQPDRHVPDWLAKGERVVGLCSAEPRRLLDLTV